MEIKDDLLFLTSKKRASKGEGGSIRKKPKVGLKLKQFFTALISHNTAEIGYEENQMDFNSIMDSLALQGITSLKVFTYT